MMMSVLHVKQQMTMGSPDRLISPFTRSHQAHTYTMTAHPGSHPLILSKTQINIIAQWGITLDQVVQGPISLI